MRTTNLLGLGLCLLLAANGCGDDVESEADKAGVGAACENDEVCQEFTEANEGGETGDAELVCLPQFTGGYCGLSDCVNNDDCPEQSACVAHDDGTNYCFRLCANKSECNANRPADAESNCSANITFVDADTSGKACVPPSSS